MSRVAYVTIDATLLNYTDQAVLLLIDKAEHWLPRAAISYRSDQLVNDDNLGEPFEFQIAEWKAKQESLI